MEQKNDIDIREGTLRKTGKLLNILLIDRTTNRNIIWATDSYNDRGGEYGFAEPIKPELITGNNNYLIQPRAAKTLSEQRKRTKDIAEVFTPLTIVEKMNSEIDQSGEFQDIAEENWQGYVKALKLEIACGEAPFIVSRYDPTSRNGKIRPLEKRVGFLDKKLQVVSKYCIKKSDWLYWAKEAYKSSYGYEWQGDNLLIARENLLYTLIDYYEAKFRRRAPLSVQEEFAKIISWNIFQMDGLKYVVPMSCYKQTRVKTGENALFWNTPDSIELFDCVGCRLNNHYKHNGTHVKIMDWEVNKPVKFVELVISARNKG